jgi:hypothetical protein
MREESTSVLRKRAGRCAAALVALGLGAGSAHAVLFEITGSTYYDFDGNGTVYDIVIDNVADTATFTEHQTAGAGSALAVPGLARNPATNELIGFPDSDQTSARQHLVSIDETTYDLNDLGETAPTSGVEVNPGDYINYAENGAFNNAGTYLYFYGDHLDAADNNLDGKLFRAPAGNLNAAESLGQTDETEVLNGNFNLVDIAFDSAGNLYGIWSDTDFPVLVFQVNASTGALTFLGSVDATGPDGNGDPQGNIWGLVVGPDDELYGAYTFPGDQDSFTPTSIVRLNDDGDGTFSMDFLTSLGDTPTTIADLTIGPQVIPEPAALSLIAAGLGLVTLRRGKRL